MATKFGELLEKLSINKAEIGRKTGITRQRISELSVREKSILRFDEACLIAKALGVDMNYLAKEICGFEKDPAGTERTKPKVDE